MLERAVGKNEKLKSFKLKNLKMEIFAEVGKSQTKLERTERSWKEPIKVEKNRAKLESFAEVGKFHCSWKVLVEVEKFE